MKKLSILSLCLFSFFMGVTTRAGAQTDEAEQLALDLGKLSQIKGVLQNMYDAYKIISDGYEKVKNVTSGNYGLHEAFIDGLLLVNPNIRNYERVADIISYQGNILSEYKNALAGFKQSNLFSPDEITYLAGVYGNLFDQSLGNLDELTLVLTENNLRMGDGERLTAIDRLYTDMKNKLSYLRGFDRRTDAVMRGREAQQRAAQTFKQLYDVTP